jgi:hypothetical protein
MADKARNESSTSGSSSLPDAMPSALTDLILEAIDAETLPPKVQKAMGEIGPFLWRGFTYTEIARRLDRSEDWVSMRVVEARTAIAEQVLETAGDELPEDLRMRLEAFLPRRPPLEPPAV